MEIPTGYQDKTGFHLLSNLLKRKSTGRELDELCEMHRDAGRHTDTPRMFLTGFLDHELYSRLIKAEVVAADYQVECALARTPNLRSRYVA